MDEKIARILWLLTLTDRPVEAEQWFFSPSPDLGGESPQSLIDKYRDPVADLIINMLERGLNFRVYTEPPDAGGEA